MSAQIYVASLSDYNAGTLHGAWLDVPTDPDELMDAITAMLATSREPIAEEWAIHDYDGFPNMGEYPGVEALCTMAAALEEVTENGLEDAFTAWIADSSYNAEHPDKFRDAYLGTYDNEADYGYEWAEQSGLLSQLDEVGMTSYVDWEHYGKNLLMDASTIDGPMGSIHVFDPNA